MKQPAHTIELTPWQSASIGVRVVCEATNAMLWPLQPDDRMTALISLLANHICDVAENDDQIDAIIDVLRMQLKMSLAAESPPLQSN
ncbi:hypothetical protein KIP88_03150 [Bradyrhizobium sp. SRL28]|uniref:hypothetical protein n=1 Tax=Bradyrhizobium sp. SRL28 TaxID=2836178 RepID=UPI001BDF3E03|nr:hypothetical protein [Bradyrhizobium sp. SRL28]MBT1509490.1 hypothetical protein [Bradyrhizobium sp. SRL28]